ncbi:EamA family transporter, partial [Leptospira sp. SA-E8]|uniref:EamA family transporter n=1 Tax=Leptospira sp. SA-E8 TaxID=3422259 RepID=UPI003EB6CCC6
RVAVADFNPTFLTCARASIAALLGLALLLLLRQPRPRRADAPALAVTALGVVVGFPLLTALALQYVTSAHSIVFIGLLPLATAIFAVVRGGERPRPVFWLFSVSGAAFVAGYAAWAGMKSGVEAKLVGDLLTLGAV